MKDTTLRHRKMVLLALASIALLTSSVRAATNITAQLDDLILGFYATGSPGSAYDLEIDLGSVSQFYNATPGSMIPLHGLAVQDLINVYGSSWHSRTDVWWGAVATDGNESDANGKPQKTLWATAPNGAAAWVPGSLFSQATPESVIATMYSGGVGSLNGATSTTNSTTAAIITASQAGSYFAEDFETPGVSFSYFNPTVDNTADIADSGGQVVSQVYEMIPGHASSTLLGNLVLTQTGLSFQAASANQDPFVTWQELYFGSATNPAAAANADPLGKGISNTNQFLLGLNPTNAASVFRITSILRTPPNTTITWKAAGVKTNVLQGATGTANGGYSNNFVDIATIILNVAGDTSTNCVDHSGTNHYYRIRLSP